jgi:pimeloyl-ACP methyl ester carboxylesterase
LGIGPFAEDAWDLMQYLGHAQFIAGGISMGAAVALNLALCHPSSVKALILVRPAWLNQPAPDNLRSIIRIGKLLKKYPLPEALKKFQSSRIYKQYQRDYPAVATSMVSQFNAEHASERSCRLIRIPETVPYESNADLNAIQCPALVVATDRDPVHPLGLAQELAGLLPSSTFITVTSKSEDEEKHITECSQAISDFLTQIRI